MKKLLIYCFVITAAGSIFQKKAQIWIKSWSYSQPDNDPNSSTRKLAAQQRESAEREETVRRTIVERNNADFERRMKALGVLPLSVPADKMAIYLFNDSTRKITFSFVHADGSSTGDSDVQVAPGGHDDTEIKFGGVVYILAKGTPYRWRVDMSEMRMRVNRCGGCVYSD